ncbi:Small ubiquitin-related modifier 2 [Turdus rufiventris]|nr:Small ubiquitin-related modifier 2 [Turdus rufiventris]
MADEKPKEGVKTENNDHINLKVAGQDGSVVQFKIKRHTPLSKLMKAYCERQIFKDAIAYSEVTIRCRVQFYLPFREFEDCLFVYKVLAYKILEVSFILSLKQGLSMRQIRFRFDGQPINESDTPAQLEMEDEDTIDVFQQQTGGVY